MKKYEVMAIFSNTCKEADVEKHIKSLVDRLKAGKGTVTFEDYWGARGFAYKIEKQTWGYYYVAQFEMEAKALAELRKDLNLEKSIVRFLISTVDPKAPAPRPYAEMKQEYEVSEKEKAAETGKVAKGHKESGRPVKLSTVAKEEPSKPEAEVSVAPKTEAKKVAVAPAPPVAEKKDTPNKDAVDKKLDDIINDSALDL